MMQRYQNLPLPLPLPIPASAYTGDESRQNSHEESSRPTKRARKALSCPACRRNKLKCSRERPCSGCILRGTIDSCYAEDVKLEGLEPVVILNTEESPPPPQPSTDVRAELARIRQSLAVLEAQFGHSPQHSPGPTPHSRAQSSSSQGNHFADEAPPRPRDGGMFVGATSAATPLLYLRGERGETDDSDASSSQDTRVESRISASSQHNLDLLTHLPEDIAIVDELIERYFDTCTWFYAHLNKPAFTQSWSRFKQSTYPDNIVLATVFVVLAISLQYLPNDHPLLHSFSGDPRAIGDHYYSVAATALERYRAERRPPSLDLVELLLLQTHYLSISKSDCEEVWMIRSELVSSATAMGLHRDPGRWKMAKDLVLRRRWAWWNIMLVERWHAFLFGRPLAISSRHFDTLFPMEDFQDTRSMLVADCPDLSYLMNFRLSIIIGNVVDDAVSVLPVSYERVMSHDRDIEKWLSNLPPDIDLDDTRLARGLSPPSSVPQRRRAVQSLCLRAQALHVRFTLHRPFTTPQLRQAVGQYSFDTAVAAADKLIQLIMLARPEYLANTSLLNPGHVFWGGYHVFAAAIFLAFQLILRPEQPGTALFREDIQRAMVALENLAGGITVAAKGLKILRALAPLYEGSPMDDKKRSECVAIVRRLAFPCLDSPVYPRSAVDSPQGLTQSPSSSVSPSGVAAPIIADNTGMVNLPPQQTGQPMEYGPFPVNSSQEAVWSSCLGLDSSDWGRAMKDVLRRPEMGRQM